MKQRKILIKWVLCLSTSGTLLQFANCGPDTAALLTSSTMQIGVVLVGGLVDAVGFALRQALGIQSTATTTTAATTPTTGA